MKVGYIRGSTTNQNPARKEEALRKHEVERVFAEKISGKYMNRPKLKELLDFVREGDTVIVESYSSLARSKKISSSSSTSSRRRKCRSSPGRRISIRIRRMASLCLRFSQYFPCSDVNVHFNVRQKELPSPRQKASTKAENLSTSLLTGIMSSVCTNLRS